MPPSSSSPASSAGAPDRATRRRAKLRQATGWSSIGVALAATYVCFGSSPAGTKAALSSFPPLMIMGVRGLIGGAALSTWALLSGAVRPEPLQVASALAVGTLILALGAGLGTVGQQWLASGVVGVLSAMIPILAICVGFALFREKPARRTVLGLAIGVVGIAVLVQPGSALDPFGLVLIGVSVFAWALGSVLAPRLRLPEDPRLAAGLELLSGSVVLLAASAVWGEWARLDLSGATRGAWLGLGWLVLTAVGGFTAYGYLTQRVPTSISTTFCYVNPVIALGLGWYLFDEPLSLRMAIATVVVISGVFLIVSAGKTDDPTPPHRHGHHPLTSGHGHFPPRGPAPRIGE